MTETIDLGVYVGQLLDEVRVAREQRDLDALDIIAAKIQWITDQLEQQEQAETIDDDDDFAVVKKVVH